MLACHAFAPLAMLLVALPATADEMPPIPDASLIPPIPYLASSDACGACDDPACEGHFCPLRLMGRYHSWYFQKDALLLYRTSGIRRPLAITSDSLQTVLDTGNLDFGFRPGGRLLIGHRLGVDCGWELSYFGLLERSEAAVADWNNLDIPGTLRGVADDFSDADRIAASYWAGLHNAEANAVWDGELWTALAGVRYLHLNDALMLTATDSDSGTSNYTIHSQTDLIGPQVGFRAGRVMNRWGWELTMKTGLFGSVLRQQQRLLDDNNTFVRRDSSAAVGSTTFLGDINVGGWRQLNDAWSLRFGYYLLYIGEVALATNQLDFDNPATSRPSVARGDLLVHGFWLGVEARW